MRNRKIGLAGVAIGTCLAAAPAASAASSDVCSKISPSQVSAIVGYKVPAGVGETTKIPASKATDGISGSVTTCTFGHETSPAALRKVVVLETETTSKPFTLDELKSQLAKSSELSKGVKLVPYSGLGEPGFYFKLSLGGIKAQGVAGYSGSRSEAADVFTSALPKAKLGQLAKLAQKL
jgi:hypothetical protein